MLTESDRRLLKKTLRKMIMESLSESDFYNSGQFFRESDFLSDNRPYEGDKKDKHEHSDSKNEKSSLVKASDYKDMGNDIYGKMKSIVPVLTSTYDDDVNTYNLTHSQLAYELYPNLDPDTARSKFSQKVTGKKRFTANEVNKLSNIISGKIA